MDLLTSAWIPVREHSMFRHIPLEQLLCDDTEYQLSLYRDDMELGALQLLISLVQVILPPHDRNELRRRASQPLDMQTYRQAISPYHDWFVLEHPEYPFMQSRGVKAKVITPIQKLFIGLPEGNNHAFFNGRGEVNQVCGSCVAIALFNQASNCPSFGGGFKGSLRGGAPITTFAAGNHLRETIWLNVLSQERIAEMTDASQVNNTPVWVDPILPKSKLQAHRIGLLRGLFWQPAHVELLDENIEGICDTCQQKAMPLYPGFRKEKFTYDLEGLWSHPHSPRIWDIKQDSKARERFLSFTTTAPAWTQLNHYILEQAEGKAGSIPAPVISQFRDVFGYQRQQRLRLLVSGYRNNKALVLERRHELFSMPQDWDANARYVEEGIKYALDVKQELRNKLYGFAKQVGPSVHDIAERQFYEATETMIHNLLHDMNFQEGRARLIDFKAQVAQLGRDIFEAMTEPYRHDPEGLKYFSLFKRGFEGALAKLNA